MKVAVIFLALAATAYAVPAHSAVKGEPIQLDDVRVVTYVQDDQGFRAQIKNQDGTITEKDAAEVSIQNAKTVEVAPVRYSVKHSPVVHYYAGWPFLGGVRKKNRPQVVVKPEAEVAPSAEPAPVTFYGSEFPSEFFAEQGQAQRSGEPVQFEKKADGSFVQIVPKINFFSDSWPVLEDRKDDVDEDVDDDDHKIVRKIPSVLGEWPEHGKKDNTKVKVSEEGTSSSHHFSGGVFHVSQESKTDEQSPYRIVQKIPSVALTGVPQTKPVAQSQWPFTQLVSHANQVPVTVPLVSYTGGWPVASPFQHAAQFPIKSSQFAGSQLSVPVVAYTGNWPALSQAPFNHQIKHVAAPGASVPLVTYSGSWPIGQGVQAHAAAGRETVDFKSVIAQSSASPVIVPAGGDKFPIVPQYQWGTKSGTHAEIKSPPHIPGYVAVPVW